MSNRSAFSASARLAHGLIAEPASAIVAAMPKSHRVQPGECLATIAEAHGLFPATIWEHPDNEELRRVRRDGHVLLAGDMLAIPDRTPRRAKCATDARHVFRRKAVPTPLHLRMLVHGEPLAQVPYRLIFGEREERGQTGADGSVHAWLPRDAREASLFVEVDGVEHERIIALGGLDPINTPTGLAQRLVNLRYLDPDESDSRELRRAIKSFQLDAGVSPSGELDPATEDALVAAHGS
jgi:hypothetical protein